MLPTMIPAICPLFPLFKPDFEVSAGNVDEGAPEGFDSGELVGVDALECGCSPSEVALDELDDLATVTAAFESETVQDEEETPVPLVAV